MVICDLKVFTPELMEKEEASGALGLEFKNPDLLLLRVPVGAASV